MFTLKHKNGIWYGTFQHLTDAKIKHGISARLGGVSKVPYATLDLGLHTGDDKAAVRENRGRFFQALELDLTKAATCEQVHADRIAIVTEEDAGKGAEVYEEALQGIDALITNVKDLPLLLFFADCVPILIVDPVHRAIGLSHAGWKGTVAKIGQKTILAMQQHFATKPEDCLVGIAPSIGPCCYEVDDVVAEKVKAAFPYWEDLLTPQGRRWRLNLWKTNQRQLEDIGVNPKNIAVSQVCTSCNKELFFSYRAEQGVTGRIGAVISL
ncbi:MAG: peptidoglycan editing factor PgeF [Pelosinus sp.]|nr:peptidoglycan editing factor PgeF [Pelosinus sp.]